VQLLLALAIVDGGIELALQYLVLRLEVEQWNGDGFGHSYLRMINASEDRIDNETFFDLLISCNDLLG
jgi:hypothetical protein